MKRILTFVCALNLCFALYSQESITYDTVPFNFWGSTFWKYNSAVDQVRDPQNNLLLAVRKYYTTGQISEEYLRVSDTSWFYQQFDSIDPTRLLVKGMYVADPEYQAMDTILTFDPSTYEESIQLRCSRYGFKTGPWLEQDRNGYLWTGIYEDDLREGLWQKRDAYDYTELRGFVYFGGEIVRDSTLNWALSTDTSTILELLSEGVVPGQRGGIVSTNTPGGLWRLCSISPDAYGRNKIWTFTHLAYLPGQCTNESWGNYVFLPDRKLLYGLSAPSGMVSDEGRWDLLDGNRLLLSLRKRGDIRFQMKYLADGQLILTELPY